jgi:hypothetical protein
MICVKRLKIEKESEAGAFGRGEGAFESERGWIRESKNHQEIKENSLREKSPQKMQSKSNRKLLQNK